MTNSGYALLSWMAMGLAGCYLYLVISWSRWPWLTYSHRKSQAVAAVALVIFGPISLLSMAAMVPIERFVLGKTERWRWTALTLDDIYVACHQRYPGMRLKEMHRLGLLPDTFWPSDEVSTT